MSRNDRMIKVAFFPYNASMWDSMESIFFAARDDERCEVIVCPIPYYEIEQNTSRRRIRYEGDRFPADIPITKYSDLNLDEERVDIAYIHNPYDETNLVTRVHKNYYSSVLKEKVGTLVYVSYYADFGPLSDNKKALPAFYYADYIVLPTKRARESCKGLPFYHKILDFGSPKFDRVIRKCREGAKVPEEWRIAFAGRKVLLLNTSIAEVLSFGAQIFDKLAYVFDTARDYPGIGILWRPHPLLEATLRSMRPDLLVRYGELLTKFKQTSMGVIDDTSDVTESVAFVDGYMAFNGGSSVDSLMMVAGKPMYRLQGDVCREYDEKPPLRAVAVGYMEDRFYVVFRGISALFSFQKGDVAALTLEKVLNKENLWRRDVYRGAVVVGSKIYIKGLRINDSITYDIHRKESASLYSGSRSTELESAIYWGAALKSNERVIFVSYSNAATMEYDTKKHKWVNYTDAVRKLYDRYEPEGNTYFISQGYRTYQGKLYLSTATNNEILSINLSNSKAKRLTIGDRKRIALKGANSEGLWFVDRDHLELIICAPWDALTNEEKWEQYNLFQYRPGNYVESRKIGLYGDLIEMENCFVILPSKLPRLFCIDKQTKRISTIADDFWEEGYHDGLQYDYKMDDIVALALKIDGLHILMQRYADGKWICVNVDKKTYETFGLSIDEDSYHTLMNINKGFNLDHTDEMYYMEESEIFHLRYFFSEFERSGYRDEGRRGRAILSEGMDYLAGNAGRELHGFLMRTIK